MKRVTRVGEGWSWWAQLIKSLGQNKYLSGSTKAHYFELLLECFAFDSCFDS